MIFKASRLAQVCCCCASLLLLALALAAEGEAELWSLRPIGNPAPPPSTGVAQANPIDAFVAAAHRRDGAQPAPPAGRRALIRRASYDLTGLPPEPAAVEAFAKDRRSDSVAFRDVVEDLLASPHYGERWGRHWLDVVRYADTAGENSDHPLPHAWRYRNWVIDAFNRDKPYDEFVREQLAGDILAPTKPEAERAASIVATGYLAIARRFGHDIDKSMHLTYEDVIDNLGKAFLGLSISCARCHDHKHDPIRMDDYYSLYAVFDSTRFAFPGCEPQQQPRDLVPISASPEFLAERKRWEKRLEKLKAEAQTSGVEAKATLLKELAAASLKLVSSGDVPDSGSVLVTEKPIEIAVRKGEAIQLSILPRGNYGADTTILDYAITHASGGGETRWSVGDLLDDLLRSNPLPAAGGAEWCFLDTAGGMPKFLVGAKDGVDGNAVLKAWENGTTPPSVLTNSSTSPVSAWTTLPPRTFFCHPGPNGPIAIAWLSPVDGTVQIELKVSDGHPGGDGVAWRLEHFADTAIAAAYRGLGRAGGGESALRAHLASEPVAASAYAVAEGETKPAKLQLRGDPETLGDEIAKQFLGALGGGTLGDRSASGRLELAERITAADNPLAARVMANRIWGWHFGRGLVATPNDFGNHGARPTHPELLDFLARELIEGGWSVKAMHRLIMASESYRRAAGDDGAAADYTGFGRRRLSAEELRDTLLVAAGKLDRSPGEAHPFPAESSWGFTQHAPFADDYPTAKRSVYVMRKRNRATPFFALFDGPDPNASIPARGLTTVPTQALYFMNDPFFHDCADQFAARVRAAGPDERLDLVCRQLFARPADGADRDAFENFAAALSPTLATDPEERDTELWRSYARVLFSSNEFLFLD